MPIQPLGAQAIACKTNISDNSSNTMFTGATYNNSSDRNRNNTKDYNAKFRRAMTYLSLLCIGTLAVMLGATKIKLTKNLKTLSEKLGEAPKKQIEEHLNNFSLSSKKHITDELIKNDSIKKMSPNKIKALIANIAAKNSINKETLQDKIVNLLTFIP